jgi:hypothetical protein
VVQLRNRARLRWRAAAGRSRGLAWDLALALSAAIACIGDLIRDIVRRARNQAAGEEDGLSARFFGLLALGALTGVLLVVWFG